MSKIFYIVLLSILGVKIGFSQYQKAPDFANKVYEDLYKNLYITKKVEKPVLSYVDDDKTEIITFKPSQNGEKSKLIIGSEFIKVIRTFDADSMNALAFVMGHEMAHIFLEQSDNIEKVGGGYANKDLKKELKQVKDSLYSKIFERQADEWAIFYSHLGGYKTTHVADKILDKVYTHFKLPNKLHGYPELKERKIIAASSALKMKLLLERFDLANLCLMSKNYDVAKNIFEAILNEGFKSSEIYNNLGVCLMLKVIQSDTLFQKYQWPIFLDSKSKLSSIQQRDIFGVDIKETLFKAIEYFRLASEDKENKLANLNLAIAHLLIDISKEDLENDHINECNYFLNKVSNKLTQTNTLKGILAHYIGKFDEAEQILLDNSEINIISKRNYNLLFGNKSNLLSIENPLKSVLKFEENLPELFFDSKGIVRDSASRGTKPILPSFSNISIDIKTTERMQCSRIFEKSLNTKIYIAKLNSSGENLSENLLKDYSEFVFDSNLYKYYIYMDWIIRIDLKGNKTIYKTR